jgi:transaldolase
MKGSILKKTEIYIDGPNKEDMMELQRADVSGYTFNPTLFKNLGVSDYLEYSKEVIKLSNGLPVSLEVIGDAHQEMITQAKKLSSLADNVYVKIPITYTSGQSTLDTISRLAEDGIKQNITAIFTIEQIKGVLPALEHSRAIISVFAGRLYDIGLNAAELVLEMSNHVHNNSNCNVLWASPRMHYDLIIAQQSGCDIITMSSQMYKKISLLGKSPTDYSLETVKMFYNDAKSSGFTI